MFVAQWCKIASINSECEIGSMMNCTDRCSHIDQYLKIPFEWRYKQITKNSFELTQKIITIKQFKTTYFLNTTFCSCIIVVIYLNFRTYRLIKYACTLLNCTNFSVWADYKSECDQKLQRSHSINRFKGVMDGQT